MIGINISIQFVILCSDLFYLVLLLLHCQYLVTLSKHKRNFPVLSILFYPLNLLN